MSPAARKIAFAPRAPRGELAEVLDQLDDMGSDDDMGSAPARDPITPATPTRGLVAVLTLETDQDTRTLLAAFTAAPAGADVVLTPSKTPPTAPPP